MARFDKGRELDLTEGTDYARFDMRAIIQSFKAFNHSNIKAIKHSNLQTLKHSNIKTFKHQNIQTSKHQNIQTSKHSIIQSFTINHSAFTINNSFNHSKNLAPS
jgi:hypothetical protein